jgi:hypothetical protein
VHRVDHFKGAEITLHLQLGKPCARRCARAVVAHNSLPVYRVLGRAIDIDIRNVEVANIARGRAGARGGAASGARRGGCRCAGHGGGVCGYRCYSRRCSGLPNVYRRSACVVVLPAVHAEVDIHLGTTLDTAHDARLDWTNYVVAELYQYARLDRNVNRLALVNHEGAAATLGTGEADITSQVLVAGATTLSAGKVVGYFNDSIVGRRAEAHSTTGVAPVVSRYRYSGIAEGRCHLRRHRLAASGRSGCRGSFRILAFVLRAVPVYPSRSGVALPETWPTGYGYGDRPARHGAAQQGGQLCCRDQKPEHA